MSAKQSALTEYIFSELPDGAELVSTQVYRKSDRRGRSYGYEFQVQYQLPGKRQILTMELEDYLVFGYLFAQAVAGGNLGLGSFEKTHHKERI